MPHFPAFLDIRGKKCLVVGGGSVASQKVRALLACAGAVQVVSPTLDPSLQRLQKNGSFEWIARDFIPSDLGGSFLAIAATNDAQVNEAVWDAANKERVLVNVVDDTPHCNFIAPSIFKRGRLQLAISTGGASPALAKKLRKQLRNMLGPEWAVALNWMGNARKEVLRVVPTTAKRKALFSDLASTIPEAIRKKGKKVAKREFENRLRKLLVRFGRN
jgi:precorrin-2 dehydrogenase / sirohydrochlorin ferrochelatase